MSDTINTMGIDLVQVAERLEALERFTSVTDILAAAEAMDADAPATVPAAFVATTSEQANPAIKLQDRHRQQIIVTITVLFVEHVASLTKDAKQQVEETRKAITLSLAGWQPVGAERALEYAGYRVARIDDGYVWGEVSFTATYRLTPG